MSPPPPPPPKSKSKKQKIASIPPPETSDSSDEENETGSSIKTKTDINCPICPNFLTNGYTKKDGRFYLFCKGEGCSISWCEESSAGNYIVKAKKDVLKKYKHPNPNVRCYCDMGTRLIWVRYSDNTYINDRMFFVCKVSKTEGGKCGFVLSADEMNTENARNLAAHFASTEKKAAKKASQNNERLLHNVREAEQTYNSIKKRKEGAAKAKATKSKKK